MNDIKPHSISVDDAIDKLNSNIEKGLSDKEASSRLKKHGPNKLEKAKEKSIWQLIIDQFKSAIIYLLLAAAAVSFTFNEIPEGIAIMVVIFLNTAIGFFMEYQAQTSMVELKKMDKITSSVVRQGQRKEIDAEKLVPGDIILVEEGKLVAADCRLLEQNELKINESALTGESFPVEKHNDPLEADTALADRKNMIFKGTSVNMGKGKALVISTGMNTAIGDISKMVSEEEKEKIPLTKKLNKLSKRLIWIVLGLAAAYGIIGFLTGQQLLIMVQTAIAWAIAAIPEGLAIVATVALANGMKRLAKEKVIVKKLAAVETLGETTTILTDKTGTLTQNQLSAEQLVTEDQDIKAAELKKKEIKDNDPLDLLIKIASLCNNTHTDEEGNLQGDTVEVSLAQFVGNLEEGLFKRLNEEYRRKDEDPFDSESKFMATAHEKDGEWFYSMKGATSVVLDRCKKVATSSGEEQLDDKKKKKWQEEDNRLSAEGLKTLGFAYKKTNNEESLESDYVFTGLIGFLDPPKEEVKKAIKTCQEAGIRVVMITGDHPETSKNIAKQIGIRKEDDTTAYSGKDLQKIAKEDKQKIYDSNIFARVDPRQKLDILEVFKKSGDIVGMTGDGVNDAPVLKKADIGIAMGKRGSQVAQEYADMVLKDDDFTSIVIAIKQGRIIFQNIRKFVVYQLSYHLSEIIVIAAISFSVFNLPLLPLQLLFLNLLVDVFPALALGLSRGMPQVMQQPPKDPEEPILTSQSWLKISSYGFIMAVWVIGAYFYGFFVMEVSKEIANNIAFFSLSFMQLGHVFNMRENEEHFLKNQVTQNKYVWYAIAFCAVVLLAAYFIPGINTILSFQPMGAGPWLLIAATIVFSITSIQLLKLFRVLK